MNLQSNKTTVQKSDKNLFEFLTDTSNFQDILPDNLEQFEILDDAFNFSLKGMPTIKMFYTEKTPNQTVRLQADNDAFPVVLTCEISSLTENTCEAQLFFEGEINMMMAMMVKKPLQNLLDTLAKKMGKL